MSNPHLIKKETIQAAQCVPSGTTARRYPQTIVSDNAEKHLEHLERGGAHTAAMAAAHRILKING